MRLLESSVALRATNVTNVERPAPRMPTEGWFLIAIEASILPFCSRLLWSVLNVHGSSSGHDATAFAGLSRRKPKGVEISTKLFPGLHLSRECGSNACRKCDRNFQRYFGLRMEKTVGILGGGQLGRMLSEAANRLNVKVVTLGELLLQFLTILRKVQTGRWVSSSRPLINSMPDRRRTIPSATNQLHEPCQWLFQGP